MCVCVYQVMKITEEVGFLVSCNLHSTVQRRERVSGGDITIFLKYRKTTLQCRHGFVNLQFTVTYDVKTMFASVWVHTHLTYMYCIAKCTVCAIDNPCLYLVGGYSSHPLCVRLCVCLSVCLLLLYRLYAAYNTVATTVPLQSD